MILTIDEAAVSHTSNTTVMFKHVEQCLRLAPHFVNVTLSLHDSQLCCVSRNKTSARLVGTLKLQRRPEDGWNNNLWEDAFERAQQLDLDLVKFSMPADSMADNMALAIAKRDIQRFFPRLRLIGFNAGA